ncbi:MAG: hypothetical protein KDC87_03295 [Planctomycetes bacterium]|nr:hypothetical protein [Planctomycetota bacterium]MCB9871890.1 hypothetical protein [Planctomycetota bacterium]MCB9888840.1 hypothetical protein [Planctomycetota bacterium]
MKHKTTTLLALATPVVLLFPEPGLSKRTGLFPNTVVDMINVGSLTRVASTSCGQCHLNAHGGVTVTATVQNRVIATGASTSLTLTGSSAIPGNAGGFCMDATAGGFVAGTNTYTNAAGDAITHMASTARSWTFSWKAPATPGLAELYTAVNTANGDLRNTGDMFGFHGANPNDTVSTPVRLYANATGCVAVGDSCSDGYGNFSVLGGASVPSVGNTGFKVEGFGLPPSAPLLFMLSLGKNLGGFDMAPLGAPGCVLRTTLQIQITAATSGGSASRAEGSFSAPLPIPNDPNLRGIGFTVQMGAIDNNSTRAFPLLVTNGLEVTIQ